MPDRIWSRADLDLLKTFDRNRVLEVLESFDERQLSAGELALRTAGLLEDQQVPGLADAAAAGNPEAVGRAVVAACLRKAIELPLEVDDAERALADDVLVHRFRFYTETHELPERIDWDYNPGTWHWGHDLNRFTFLEPLVKAYGASGDERYGRKAVELILSWIRSCDIGSCFAGTPYAFGSYLNNAIHCQAWAKCILMLLPHGQVTAEELLVILKSIHDQLQYLAVVTNGHHGNWPTIGCRGVLRTLAHLPVYRATGPLVSYCIDAFARQIDEQVLPDGVQDELTPHYHAGVLGNLLEAARSLKELEEEPVARTFERRALEDRTQTVIGAMLRYQQQTIMPDRSAQLAFNDSDPEVVPDVRGSLEALGLEHLIVPEKELGPELYPYAGVAFLRTRADRGDLYCAFDGGPFGRSHQHEDKLGFQLYAFGRSFIVDPGRHLYDHSSVSFFPYLRSTRAHSTILIDGHGQNSRARPETWIATEPVPMTFTAGAGEVRAASCYDLGYGPDNAIDAVHRREIVLVSDLFWIVFDRVEGRGDHHVESRFQFCPSVLSFDPAAGRAVTGFEDANLLLCSASRWDESRIDRGSENPRGGWYSPSYSRIEPAPALAFSTTTALPLFTATLLLPFRGALAPVAGLELDGTRAVVRLSGSVYRVETTLR